MALSKFRSFDNFTCESKVKKIKNKVTLKENDCRVNKICNDEQLKAELERLRIARIVTDKDLSQRMTF